MHDYAEQLLVTPDELRALIWKTSAQIVAMTEAYYGQPAADCGDYALRVVPSL